MFFRDPQGNHYAISEVIRISAGYSVEKKKKNKETEFRFLVTLRDGTELEVTTYDARQILSQPINAMPAQSGTYIMDRILGEEEWYREPVIGWCVSEEYGIRAVTLDGVVDTENKLILLSDGRVTVPNRETFGSFEAYLNYLNSKV